MKQKLKLWLAVAVMLLGLELPVSRISAATDPQYFEFDAAAGTIVNYNPSGPKDVVIPEQIDGVAVQAIGRAAFSYRELISVVIPDSVREIGDGAFLSNQLAEIVIPSSVQTIGAHAFSMNMLRQLTLPDSVVEMGENAFMMNGLTKLTLSRSLSRIAKGAFVFNKLSEVQIPDTVTEIERSAFSLNDLTSVVLPDSVTLIESAAFSNNQLTEIALPDSVTRIGEAAFRNNQLTKVEIPDSVAVIGSVAFGRNELTDVSVSHYCLCEDAFDPDVSVVHREPTASSLLQPLSFSLAGTMREISETDLACTVTATMRNPHPVTAHHVQVSLDFPAGIALAEGEPIVALGDLGTEESRAVTWELRLPKECLYETDIFSLSAEGDNFASSTQQFDYRHAQGYEIITEGDYTFNKTTGMITGYSDSGPKDIVIPNQIAGKTVLGIGSSAFVGKNLTSVSFPDSLIFISYSAFSRNQLTRVELPDSLRFLNMYSFNDNQLMEVILSESLSVIPYAAFYNNQLAAVTIPDSVIYLDGMAFLNNQLTSVDIPPQCIVNGGAFDGVVQTKRR